MPDESDYQTASQSVEPEYIPPGERPGHEQPHDGDDAVVTTTHTGDDGVEWAVIGNMQGVLCMHASDVVEVER